MTPKTPTPVPESLPDVEGWLINRSKDKPVGERYSFDEVIELIKSWQKSQQVYGEWQLCPKCNGGGRAMNMDNLIPSTIDICDVCNGNKIIEKPLQSQQGQEQELDNLAKQQS